MCVFGFREVLVLEALLPPWWERSPSQVAVSTAVSGAPCRSEDGGAGGGRPAGARLDGEGTPGEVVEVSDEGVTVQGNGGRILIKRVRAAGAGKQPAMEWASSAGLSAGQKLGS